MIGLPRLHMLFAEFGDDIGARSMLVAEKPGNSARATISAR